MKYSKPDLVIKKSCVKRKDNGEDETLYLNKLYQGLGDIITIGIKRDVITGRTKEDCKNKGGKIRRVYGHQKDSDMRVSDACEFRKNGKEVLESIEEDQHGMWVGVPISMIDEVIKQLQEFKKLKK